MFINIRNRNLDNDYSYEMVINLDMMESINKMVNDDLYCIKFPSSCQSMPPVYVDRKDAERIFDIIGVSL